MQSCDNFIKSKLSKELNYKSSVSRVKVAYRNYFLFNFDKNNFNFMPSSVKVPVLSKATTLTLPPTAT